MNKRLIAFLLTILFLLCAINVFPLSVSAKHVDRTIEETVSTSVSTDKEVIISEEDLLTEFPTDKGCLEIASLGSDVEMSDTGIAKTADEAAQWAVSQNGKPLDYDGNYGAQCVDFIYYYYAYLGVPVAGGHAYYYMWNSLPSGWYRTASPSKGDIIVWDKDYSNPNDFGHIGIVVNVNGAYIDYMDQNSWEYGKYVGRHNGYLASKAGTYIHPDFASPEPKPDFTPVDVGTNFYANIVCLNSGKVATVSNYNVLLGSKNGDENQKWRFERQGDTSYKIINVATGYCLDVSNSSSANETNIQLCPSNDTNAQRWYFKYVGDGLSLVPKCAINSCLDIHSGLMDDGTNIQLFQQNSTAAQIFGLNAQPAFSAINIGNDFTASIIYNESGSAVTIDSFGNVVVRPYDGSLNQQWRFLRMSDRAYKITNVGTGRCLDVANAANANKTNIWTVDSNDTAAQRWFVRMNGGGYSFVPKCAVNSAMDLDNGITDNNSNIQIYSYIDNGLHQVFSLKYVLNAIEVKSYNSNTYVLYNYEIPWREAYKYCEEQGGHMVTINSSGEQEFIHNLLKTSNSRQNLWLGALDTYSEGTWRWITGEKMNYVNWADGEPNDNNDEDYLMLYKNSGKWNDAHDIYNDFSDSYGFICEYELNDSKLNYTPEKSFVYNNHRYEFYADCADWQTAKRFCEQKGGHLVTVTDTSENSAIIANSTGLSRTRYWIGLTDIQIESQWKWINGESVSFTNWDTGEPNNAFGAEDYAEILLSNGKWNDTKGFSCTYLNIGFICEYDDIKDYILGDVDNDGDVEIRDATWIQRHVTKEEMPFTISKTTADVDVDGNITVMDATVIQYYLANMKTAYKIGEKIE